MDEKFATFEISYSVQNANKCISMHINYTFSPKSVRFPQKFYKAVVQLKYSENEPINFLNDYTETF